MDNNQEPTAQNQAGNGDGNNQTSPAPNAAPQSDSQTNSAQPQPNTNQPQPPANNIPPQASSVSPQASNTPKKPFYQQWWFWLIIVGVVVAAAAIIAVVVTQSSGQSSNQTSTDNNSQNTSAEQNSAENNGNNENQNQSSSEEVFQIGDKVSAGGIEYVVTDFERNVDFSSKYYTPDEGNEFVLVTLTVTNLEDEPTEHYLGGLEWNIIDADGEIYDTASPTYSTESPLSSERLEGGESKTYTLVYEVPEGSKGLKFKYNFYYFDNLDDYSVELD